MHQRIRRIIVTSSMFFRKKLFNEHRQFLLQLIVERAAGAPGETSVYAAHFAVTTQKETRRPRIQVDGLRYLLVQLAGFTRQQHGVLNTVSIDECPQSPGILELIFLFKRNSDNFETPRAILAVQLHQERRFVMAIGTPAPAYG